MAKVRDGREQRADTHRRRSHTNCAGTETLKPVSHIFFIAQKESHSSWIVVAGFRAATRVNCWLPVVPPKQTVEHARVTTVVAELRLNTHEVPPYPDPVPFECWWQFEDPARCPFGWLVWDDHAEHTTNG